MHTPKCLSILACISACNRTGGARLCACFMHVHIRWHGSVILCMALQRCEHMGLLLCLPSEWTPLNSHKLPLKSLHSVRTNPALNYTVPHSRCRYLKCRNHLRMCHSSQLHWPTLKWFKSHNKGWAHQTCHGVISAMFCFELACFQACPTFISLDAESVNTPQH